MVGWLGAVYVPPRGLVFGASGVLMAVSWACVLDSYLVELHAHPLCRRGHGMHWVMPVVLSVLGSGALSYAPTRRGAGDDDGIPDLGDWGDDGDECATNCCERCTVRECGFFAWLSAFLVAVIVNVWIALRHYIGFDPGYEPHDGGYTATWTGGDGSVTVEALPPTCLQTIHWPGYMIIASTLAFCACVLLRVWGKQMRPHAALAGRDGGSMGFDE